MRNFKLLEEVNVVGTITGNIYQKKKVWLKTNCNGSLLSIVFPEKYSPMCTDHPQMTSNTAR